MLLDMPLYMSYQVLKTTDDWELKMFYLKETNSIYQVIRGTYFTQDDVESLKKNKHEWVNRKNMILACEWETWETIYLLAETIELPLDWFDIIAKSKKWTMKEKENKIFQIASIFTESMWFSKHFTEGDWIMFNYKHIDKVILECFDIIKDLKKITHSDEEFCQKLTKALHSTIKYDNKFLIGGQEAFEEQSKKHPETFNIFTPVLKRYWVCESIAPLFAFICFLADIKVDIIYWINDPWVNHYNCFYKGYIYDPTMWGFYMVSQEDFENRDFEIL